MKNDDSKPVARVEDFIEHAGFGKFQYLTIAICGFYWAADAMVCLFIHLFRKEILIIILFRN